MKAAWRKIWILGAAVLMLGAVPATAMADMADVSGNYYVEQSSISRGKIGRSMNVTFSVENKTNQDWKDVRVVISSYMSGWYSEEDYVFPFEKATEKVLGAGIAAGSRRSVSMPVRVRADLKEGYYGLSVELWVKQGDDSEFRQIDGGENVNIYVSAPSANDTEDTENVDRQIAFALGEGQATPYGVYPNVLNFSINMRNSGLSDARDVTVEMVLDKDSEVFPFDINDGSYDRYYETVAAGETVQLPYSMAVREDTYSGFYELKFNIYYRETATGDLQKQEDSFWVRIKNKEHEDEQQSGATGEHAYSVARIVVDSFETQPENIISGEPFQLILRMKNASSDIPASNILLDLESETSSTGGGAVFTTLSGSSSYVINSLAPNETNELVIDMQATAGIDQRTYALKIKETYDSPEYKNAAAEISINIPVRQIARLNTGTIEVMPADISTGAESNVMFPINNTGKVLLYNVTVAFEADSIVPTDTYVGNIKPGETGNVDVMLTGAAATTDDGKVKIIITYEDENGEVQAPVEKELTLMVSEFSEENFEDVFAGQDFDVMPAEEPSFVQKYMKYLIAAAAVVAVILAVSLSAMRRRRKAKKELEELEGSDDEIS